MMIYHGTLKAGVSRGLCKKYDGVWVLSRTVIWAENGHGTCAYMPLPRDMVGGTPCQITKDAEKNLVGISGKFVEVFPETVSAWFGFKDKRGIPIFPGDVLSARFPGGYSPRNLVVQFFPATGGFICKSDIANFELTEKNAASFTVCAPKK